MTFEKTFIATSPEGIQLHHILVKGTNTEIGYQLGCLAKDGHKIDKSVSSMNASTMDASTMDTWTMDRQYDYLKDHYPDHYERMSGFAEAYGKSLTDYHYDFSFFGKALNGAACSAVHYPPEMAMSKQGCVSRNLDFPIPKKASPDASCFPFKQTYVLEMHPESSYPSLSLFCFEVFGLALEGINSQGLAVVHLADADTGIDHDGLSTNQTRRGFNEFLPIQYLLDRCSTAHEAATELEAMEHYHFAVPVHLLIADRHGDAFVYEYTPDGAEKIIVKGRPGAPLTVTNFQLNRLSDKRMREVVASRSAENGFDRYQVLQNRIAHLQLPVTEEAMRNINAAVYVHKETEDAIERTLFHNMYDTSSCTAKIRLLPSAEDTMDHFFNFSIK